MLENRLYEHNATQIIFIKHRILNKRTKIFFVSDKDVIEYARAGVKMISCRSFESTPGLLIYFFITSSEHI